jgi:hypothetical protein
LLIVGTLLASQAPSDHHKDDQLAMKIYMLLMLIAVIVGLSHLPIRVRTKPNVPAAPDSLPA